jgi:hypothetical protein
MQYLVALDTQLGLSAAEFVEAWNVSEHAAEGAAAVSEAPRQSFLPLEVTVVLLTAAVSIPTTILATFVSEYLKQKFLEDHGPKLTVTTITTPDGQPVYIINKVEK